MVIPALPRPRNVRPLVLIDHGDATDTPPRHIITQGEHLMGDQSNRQVVSGAAPKDKIAELWKMLGWEHGRIHGGQRTAAKTIVFSCRAPLVHPWFSLRTLEAFGLMTTTVPLAERKKVSVWALPAAPKVTPW